jgi:hypothetical protein
MGFAKWTVTTLLLKKGADFNSTDDLGMTLLLWKARTRHVAVITILPSPASLLFSSLLSGLLSRYSVDLPLNDLRQTRDERSLEVSVAFFDFQLIFQVDALLFLGFVVLLVLTSFPSEGC